MGPARKSPGKRVRAGVAGLASGTSRAGALARISLNFMIFS